MNSAGNWVSSGDLLSLEEEIWRYGSPGAQTAQGAGGGKPETQEDVCRAGPGQQDFKGCSWKKVLSPADRRQRVDYIRESYPVGISGPVNWSVIHVLGFITSR